MLLDIKNGIKLPLEEHYNTFPMWRYNDENNLYYPIISPDEFPEDSRDLSIKTTFISPIGIIFHGYIVGVKNIFSIGVFINNKTFHFNKNVPELSLEQFNDFIKELNLNKEIIISDIFPLQYKTEINLANYKDISGTFDVFEKLKDKRLLRWKNI